MNAYEQDARFAAAAVKNPFSVEKEVQAWIDAARFLDCDTRRPW
jgi:hypothetical protein